MFSIALEKSLWSISNYPQDLITRFCPITLTLPQLRRPGNKFTSPFEDRLFSHFRRLCKLFLKTASLSETIRMRRFLLFTLASCVLFTLPVELAAAERPNVVLILVDDLGRELLSSYGGTSYRTPRIDRLAREGLRFKNCYATPLCAPSRVEILTGCYSFRNYMSWGELPDGAVTFAQRLKQAGYATCFAGKWQLGGWEQTPPRVVQAGFDEYISYDAFKLLEDAREGRGNRFWGGTILENGRSRRLERYGPDEYSDFVIDFIHRHRNEPFLVHYCMTLMHRPFHPTPKHPDAPQPGEPPPAAWLGNRGDAENFTAMLAHVDMIVGKFLDALDELQLSDNTVVIFTSDNGTDNKAEAQSIRSEYHGGQVPGGKYFPTELGANVPLMIRWPGKVAAGQSSPALIDFTDLMATLCDLADAALPADQICDGKSLQPLFTQPQREHKRVLYTWGNFEHNSKKYKRPAKHTDSLLHIVRDERWKLYSDGRLFDLNADEFEKRPFDSTTNPEIRTARDRLETELLRLRASEPRRW